jgi:hypothetical protein
MLSSSACRPPWVSGSSPEGAVSAPRSAPHLPSPATKLGQGGLQAGGGQRPGGPVGVGGEVGCVAPMRQLDPNNRRRQS